MFALLNFTLPKQPINAHFDDWGPVNGEMSSEFPLDEEDYLSINQEFSAPWNDPYNVRCLQQQSLTSINIFSRLSVEERQTLSAVKGQNEELRASIKKADELGLPVKDVDSQPKALQAQWKAERAFDGCLEVLSAIQKRSSADESALIQILDIAARAFVNQFYPSACEAYLNSPSNSVANVPAMLILRRFRETMIPIVTTNERLLSLFEKMLPKLLLGKRVESFEWLVRKWKVTPNRTIATTMIRCSLQSKESHQCYLIWLKELSKEKGTSTRTLKSFNSF